MTNLSGIDLFLFFFFAVVAAQRQAVIHSHKGEVCGLDLVQASWLPCRCIYGLGQPTFRELENIFA